LERPLIRTPDQRLRVFVSSTLQELAEERAAAREAITRLRLTPVMFEQGARPHPPHDLYQAYLSQSHIFIGIYYQRYGWVAPDMRISGLEDEYVSAIDKPKLIYVKAPAPQREPRLADLLLRMQREGHVSYKRFSTAAELRELIENDLAVLLTERFEQPRPADVGERGVGERRRRNLPVPRNPLIGREREVRAVRELLLRDDVGLVTLTGAGGAGKSRLGLHIALDLLDRFEHGAFLVSLAPISNPDAVIAAIADVLDIRETAGGPPLSEGVKEFLRMKQILLLLDNFEHLLPGAVRIGDLLECCPGLKVLVTSRSRLRIRGEREVPVPPLAVPDAERSTNLERVAGCPAIELFVQRASCVLPGFSLTNENAPVVAEICRRLDGLPLAIELAAARIKVLPPSSLLARLENRLAVLRGGTTDLPERHQTLRSAIEWSYDLLDDGARALFRRAAVFVDGWTLGTAGSVCDVHGDGAVLDDTETLVESSLVNTLSTDAGEPRFGMLETIREYALLRLKESGEADALRARHAAHFLNLAEEAAPRMTTGGRDVWLARLDGEHGNLRAALAWSRSAKGDLQIGLRLAAALGWFWYWRGYFTEGREWLEILLARTKPAPTAVRAAALLSAGALAWPQGDFAEAEARLAQSVAICRETGRSGRRWLAPALVQLGYAQAWQGNNATARSAFREGVDLAKRTGDSWTAALALRGLGDAMVMSGDTHPARPAYEESLALFRALDDSWGIAISLGPLGRMALARGDFRAARALHEEALELLRRMGDRWNIAGQLVCLAYVALHEGDRERARALLEESLILWQDMGNRAGVTVSLAGFAALAAAEARSSAAPRRSASFRRAAQLLGAAEAMSEATGFRLHPLDRAECDRDTADVKTELGDAAFREAWSGGRAMTPAEAAAYVLRESRGDS
jgi:predicted ATPase